jgi:sortase A
MNRVVAISNHSAQVHGAKANANAGHTLLLRGKKHAAQMLIAIGVLTAAHAYYPIAKGAVAMQLIQSRYVGSEPAQRPWPGADFALSARLIVPSLAREQIILSNASARSLAFGPGFAVEPNAKRGGVISAHRDSHFAWVKDLQVGAVVQLQLAARPNQRYRVVRTHIVDSAKHRLIAPPASALLLTTCYPFDAIRAGGSMRYVVELESLDSDAIAADPLGG